MEKYVQSAPLRCVPNALTLNTRPNVTTHKLTHSVLSHTLPNDNLVSFSYLSIYCVTYCTAYSYTLFNRNDFIRCIVLFMSINGWYVPVERIWVFCLVLGMVVTLITSKCLVRKVQ